MIRYFTTLFKLNRNNCKDILYFNLAMTSFDPHLACCSLCSAKGRFAYLCSYPRYLIAYDHGVIVHHISIDRYICGSCCHTHAVLPDVLIPYGSYSVFFILAAMREYFSRGFTGKTVSGICKQYQISVSTLYDWKKRFLRCKALWLGVLKDQKYDGAFFLRTLSLFLLRRAFLERFFSRFGFSFLKAPHTSASAIP